MSIAFKSIEDLPIRSIVNPVLSLVAPGFPRPQHVAEPDLYCRQSAMPGHKQDRVANAHVAIVGCGGLGGWIAPALARAGVSRLTLIDHDFFDRTNAPRQFMFGGDIGEPKAHALARNVVPHMTNAGFVTGFAERLEPGLLAILPTIDIMVVGVDNNACRALASDYGLEHGIPVVFAMLSLDGLRAQVFLQTPGCACLQCVLPNACQRTHAPCAAASAASCQLAAAHAVQMTIGTLSDFEVPTWRETSLDGTTERTAVPDRRPECPKCCTGAAR